MKKVFIVAVIALFGFVACTGNKQASVEEPVEVQKDTIVIADTLNVTITDSISE